MSPLTSPDPSPEAGPEVGPGVSQGPNAPAGPLAEQTVDYRFSAARWLRLLGGVALLGGAVDLLLVGLTLLGLPAVVPAVALVLTGLAVAALAYAARRRPWAVRLGPGGYRVRWIRGAGATSAHWRDVAEVSVAKVEGEPCVVLGLRDGRTTLVPVALFASRPEDFLADLRARLGGTPFR